MAQLKKFAAFRTAELGQCDTRLVQRKGILAHTAKLDCLLSVKFVSRKRLLDRLLGRDRISLPADQDTTQKTTISRRFHD